MMKSAYRKMDEGCRKNKLQLAGKKRKQQPAVNLWPVAGITENGREEGCRSEEAGVAGNRRKKAGCRLEFGWSARSNEVGGKEVVGFVSFNSCRTEKSVKERKKNGIRECLTPIVTRACYHSLLPILQGEIMVRLPFLAGRRVVSEWKRTLKYRKKGVKFQHRKIQLGEIKSATDNFNNNNIIGQGGFGKVYKGALSTSKGQIRVAFKRLDHYYGQGDPEFLKEIIMLSGFTHKNLISLLGFCDEDGEKILVYDGTMALCYLHGPKETQQRVIHHDIKSSNILLDEHWNAKVSDMGLSKIGPANPKHTFLATNVVGTFGYIDPMYAEMSILTKESDVYSFGVVLFEVLCGRLCFENRNSHSQSLVRMWKQSYKQKRLDEIIFQDLKEHMDRRSLKTFSDIAYRCLHKSREDRPQMSQVVEQLEIALRFEEIPPGVVDYEVCRSSEELNILLPKGIHVNTSETNNSVNNSWSTWKADIWQTYFHSPRTRILTIAALMSEFQHLKIQLEEIKSATGNFNDNNVIGKGGFGKVYKGVLSHSKGQSTVAIKRLDRNHGQGDSEFLIEIIMLSDYTHKNLISLLGFCNEDGEKILVYEYASHGSSGSSLKIKWVHS
ncbi:hypothetical protein LXL04_029248 [Taraxacum kok-saghyz]